MKARVQLKVKAGAKKTGFSGRVGAAWNFSVAAPPVDGKANEAIMRFLAQICGVRTSAVRIVSGVASPRKLIEIDGIDNESLARVILESHGPAPYTGSASPRED